MPTDPIPSSRPRRRRWALVGLVALVVALHAWITQGVMAHLQEVGGDEATRIKRMEADIVADMELTEPPVAAAAPVEAAPPAAQEAPPEAPEPLASAASKPKKKPKPEIKPTAVTQAASEAAALPESASAPASEPVRVAEAQTTEPASQASAASAPPAASAASGPAFEWPKATRVTFKVEGYLRGPIYGNALVEWVREDMRYQVHVDAILGPRFAPIGSRRWTSEGVITPTGLAPQRFESVDKLLIKTSAPKIVTFEENELILPTGDRLPRMPGVQDAASHYIQLAYQFILNPHKLKVGSAIELPVVTTKQQENIVYDVQGEEVLETPLGKVDTFRLKPRPLKDPKAADVLAEIWVAPGLQYLPIRMLIRQGDKNYLDMQMDRRPQQTGASNAPTPITPIDPARLPK